MNRLFKTALAASMLATLAGCSSSGSDTSLSSVQDAGELRIGLEGTWQPFSYHDENDELDGGLFDFNVFTTKMTEIITPVTPKTTFWYDFGDDWLIDVKLEKIFEDKELSGRELPRVIKGKGYGIIEDCGGTDGLLALTEAFSKKEGETYEIFREWLDTDELNLTEFDIDDMNFRLKKVPRIYCDIYEYYIPPTKQSLKLLTREYKKKK